MKLNMIMNAINKKNSLVGLMLFLCVFLFGNPFVFGQQLSLDSCIVLALQNNVKTQNATLEIEAAEQVKKQAFTKYFPNVSAQAIGFHALNPIVEYGIEDIKNAGVRDLLNTLYGEYGAILGLDKNLTFFQKGVAAGVTAVQPVYVGGQIVNGNRLAKLGIEAAKYKQEVVSQEVVLATEESYWLVVSLREKQRTIHEVQMLLDTLYKDVSGACAAGLTTKNDLLKVTLKQQEMTSTLLQVENGVKLAQMALCQSIGIPFSDTLTLLDVLTDNIAEPLQYYKTLEDAVENRAEHKLLDLSVQAENLQRKMMVGESLPQVAVGAGYMYNNLFGRNDYNGLVFAIVKVPFTDWWETGHKLKQQKVKQQIAENNRRDLNEKMLLQTQQAWNELQEAYSQIALADAIVDNAQENLTLAQHNYGAGLISLSELLEAQTLYRQAIDQQCDRRITYQVKLRHYRQLTKTE